MQKTRQTSLAIANIKSTLILNFRISLQKSLMDFILSCLTATYKIMFWYENFSHIIPIFILIYSFYEFFIMFNIHSYLKAHNKYLTLAIGNGILIMKYSAMAYGGHYGGYS